MSENLRIHKTDNRNMDFLRLVSLLDDDLSQKNGAIQKQYTNHNKVDYIKDVILIYNEKDSPIACGAFKERGKDEVELKRIFVVKEERGRGISKILVKTLEEIAFSKNYQYAVLETGKNNPEAQNLYKRCGYTVIPNYEPYTNYENSVCMRKKLNGN